MTKTFEQPAADETRSSGDEKASAVKAKKIGPGKINDRFEVLWKGPGSSFRRHRG